MWAGRDKQGRRDVTVYDKQDRDRHRVTCSFTYSTLPVQVVGLVLRRWSDGHIYHRGSCSPGSEQHKVSSLRGSHWVSR
jgi:hypothetical protein